MAAPVANLSEDDVALSKFFAAEFGREAECLVRAPGRVNLIGEHIDYNGYPVLPMAIKQSILIAISTNNDNKIRIVNYIPKHAPYTCDVTEVSNITKPPAWHDYVLAGMYGIQQELKLAKLRGMSLAIWGKVPPSAGLSSSSALVCGAAVATMSLLGDTKATVNGNENSLVEQIRQQDSSLCYERIAQVCAESEQYVGTQGGGMDQAACLLSKEGSAQLISFNPLHCEPISLPKGATFVVANSLQSINKAATSDFNCRVVECKFACCILAKACDVDWEETQTLAALQQKLGKSFDDMIALVDSHLHAEPYTKQEIARLLYISEDNLTRSFLRSNTRHIEQFQLRGRAKHVFSEAQRVYQFKKICDDWRDEQKMQDSKKTEESVLQALGALMLSSHYSARDDYECSHSSLDDLVELSREHALGARLTGAGWGGCTVALVAEGSVSTHCSALGSAYYERRLSLSGDSVARALFTSPPAAGAEVVRL